MEPGYRPHKVEILANGQQFVAFNQHPSTGRPYYWATPHLDPLNIHSGYLPLLSRADAVALIKTFDDYLGRVGTPFDPAAILDTAVSGDESDLRRNIKIAEGRATWTNERAKLLAALTALDPDVNRTTWVVVIQQSATLT
jgi:hypothetical protein